MRPPRKKVKIYDNDVGILFPNPFTEIVFALNRA